MDKSSVVINVDTTEFQRQFEKARASLDGMGEAFSLVSVEASALAGSLSQFSGLYQEALDNLDQSFDDPFWHMLAVKDYLRASDLIRLTSSPAFRFRIWLIRTWYGFLDWFWGVADG